VNYWERPGFPRTSYNATRHLMTSDARLAVVRMNGCGSPRLSTGSSDPNAPDAPQLRAHGGKWQRFARREVLSVRDDFYRRNIIWRSYEGAKWTVALIRNKRKPATDRPEADFDQSEAVAGSNSAFSKMRNSSWLR